MGRGKLGGSKVSNLDHVVHQEDKDREESDNVMQVLLTCVWMQFVEIILSYTHHIFHHLCFASLKQFRSLSFLLDLSLEIQSHISLELGKLVSIILQDNFTGVHFVNLLH